MQFSKHGKKSVDYFQESEGDKQNGRQSPLDSDRVGGTADRPEKFERQNRRNRPGRMGSWRRQVSSLTQSFPIGFTPCHHLYATLVFLPFKEDYQALLFYRVFMKLQKQKKNVG